jgi:hypothetical protein
MEHIVALPWQRLHYILCRLQHKYTSTVRRFTLLGLHNNGGYANALPYYVIRTLCILFSDVTDRWATASSSASRSSSHFIAYSLLDAANRFNIEQVRQCACNITFRHMCANIVAVEKQYTHSECVLVALGLQHGVRMSHTISCGLSGSTAFFHIISRTALYSKNKLLNIKCVF